MNTTGPTTEAHERHMQAMQRLTNTQARRDYVEAVQRAEGKFAAKWLRDDFAAWWAAQPRKERA